MPSKSLTAAIASGIRAPSIKASLQSWLGVPISLQNHEFWRDFLGNSWTGRHVTVDQSMQLSTVWSCVRLIAETLSTLPLGFYQREKDGSRTSATSHGLYEILHNQPNADQTAVVFWQVAAASMLLWGNSYTEVRRSGNTVIALDFLHPARITLRRKANGEYEYLYRDSSSSKERTIAERNVMHIPAFSLDGRIGLSPVSYGANVFGTSIDTDKASAETFDSAVRSPGLLTMDMTLNTEQREQLRAHVKRVSMEGGVMVVEKGASFQQLTFSPHDAELLASRSWNVEEMCRWFRIDPAMVGHGSKDSNWGTGLEQKMLWFLTFTLTPWCRRIEQAVRKSLLTPVERAKYFAEFALEGLLRADSASRSAFFAVMRQNGLMTGDEIRQKENLPAMGGNSAVLICQVNMIPLDKLGEKQEVAPPPVIPPDDDAAISKERKSAADMLANALARPAPTINVSSPPVNVSLPPQARRKRVEIVERDESGFAKTYIQTEEY